MTATLTETSASLELTNKGLVSSELWTRLVNRIVKEQEGMTQALAERIMDQALGFLRLCAEKPGAFAPSPLVDIGWHTFILYTKAYADFCDQLAGRFIHHNPTDEAGQKQEVGVIARTVTTMKAHGINVDPMLWATTKADCNCSGGGCNAAPDCDSGD